MSEEKNQRLKEYQKKCHEAKKSQYNNKWNSYFESWFLVTHIIINKIVCAIYLYIIKSIFISFRQNHRNVFQTSFA